MLGRNSAPDASTRHPGTRWQGVVDSQKESDISTIEKVGSRLGNLCVGVFALLLGDSSGATQIANQVVEPGVIGTLSIAVNNRLLVQPPVQ